MRMQVQSMMQITLTLALQKTKLTTPIFFMSSLVDKAPLEFNNHNRHATDNLHKSRNPVQWNLSNTDTLGTKIIVLISEVYLFQGENNMFYIKFGLGQVS